jgi:hypothetical protein
LLDILIDVKHKDNTLSLLVQRNVTKDNRLKDQLLDGDFVLPGDIAYLHFDSQNSVILDKLED